MLFAIKYLTLNFYFYFHKKPIKLLVSLKSNQNIYIVSGKNYWEFKTFFTLTFLKSVLIYWYYLSTYTFCSKVRPFLPWLWKRHQNLRKLLIYPSLEDCWNCRQVWDKGVFRQCLSYFYRVNAVWVVIMSEIIVGKGLRKDRMYTPFLVLSVG